MATNNVCTLLSRIQFLMQTDHDFPQALRQRLVLETASLENTLKLKFLSGIFSSGVLCDGSRDSEALNDILRELMDTAITIACSTGADGTSGLLQGIQDGGNSVLYSRLHKWLKDDFGLIQATTGRHFPFPVQQVCVANLPANSYVHEAPAPQELEKVASFHCQTEWTRKGEFALLFNSHRLVAQLPDATVKVWNWRDEKTEERTIMLGGLYEDMTDFVYNEDAIVLGTASGHLHLFDAKTLEEKWSVRLGQPVHSLHSVQSSSATLVVCTQGFSGQKLWSLDVGCVAEMRFVQKKPLAANETLEKLEGFLVDSLHLFVLDQTCVRVYSTRTGKPIMDDDGGSRPRPCSLESPAEINSLKLIDLISAKRVVFGGCFNGLIAMWTTTKLTERQRPLRTLQGHVAAVITSGLNGHLLSLDGAGRLLMWSGYDLENEDMDFGTTIPRYLDENFTNVSIMEGCERWFATKSAQDDVINVWTLPDLWLRCG